MNILILGGTADARWLADRLIKQGLSVRYSIAGLVRVPTLDCQLLVGGFSQFGGLTCYLTEQKSKGQSIHMILDATHPYAQKMSNQAALSADEMAIPYLRFDRPAWQKKEADIWVNYQTHHELVDILKKQFPDKKNVLLSAGQFSQGELLELLSCSFETIVLRTAVEPTFLTAQPLIAERCSISGESQILFDKIIWIKAIGPFSFTAEKYLIKKHEIDVIVSKNSGGDSTSAKLNVARELNLPVLMRSRPILNSAKNVYFELQSCADYIFSVFKSGIPSDFNPSEDKY